MGRKSMIARALALAVMGASATSPAMAGIYGDDLSRCLVTQSTASDRDVLIRWIFTAIAVNPKLADMASLTKAQQDEISTRTAAIFGRLMLEDCRKQLVDAVRYEGEGVVREAFGTLGKVAMADVMRAPATGAFIAGLTSHLDMSRFKDLMIEAGAGPVDKGGTK